MDEQNNNTQVVDSQRKLDALRDLRKVDTTTWSPERLNWLWEKVKEERYAADDGGMDNAALFIANLFNPCTEHYEYRDEGYVAILNLLVGINADIHFCLWGDVPVRDIYTIHNHIARHLYVDMEVNRITAYLPVNNQKGIRLATLLGYKYEGCVRQMFRQAGKFYDVEVYGLLRSEFERKHGGA